MNDNLQIHLRRMHRSKQREFRIWAALMLFVWIWIVVIVLLIMIGDWQFAP